MSFMDEQILSKQHMDRHTLETLNNQGEKVSKKVNFWSIIDERDFFLFIADDIVFPVAGNKGECWKRTIVYTKKAAALMGVLMFVAMANFIYSVQISEVFFFAFKRSDLIPHIVGLAYVGGFMYILGNQRDNFFSIRESSRYPGLWLPVQADYTIEELLNPARDKILYLLEETKTIVRNRTDRIKAI